ncbi:hypothetical protein K8I61_09925 [bacterium]|nr:hypothetical protein [bacterium]
MLLLTCAAPAFAKDAAAGASPTAFRDRLYDVAFASDDVVVAVGYPGKVFRSTDAGNTFAPVAIGTDEPLFGIDFPSPSVGYIAARKGQVWKTADAGETWTLLSTGVEEHLFAVHFADDAHGIVVGNFGRILSTKDGGASWQTTVLEAMVSAPIFAVHMFDADNALLAGEYPIWEAQLEEDVEAETLSSIFRTADGGLTWERVAMPDTSHLFGLAFATNEIGYAVGTKGTFLETRDGGATWARIPGEIEFHLLDVAALAGGAAVAVGNAGSAARFEAGAISTVATNQFYWIGAADFNAKGRGVAVGDHGMILLSDDAGKSWRPLE